MIKKHFLSWLVVAVIIGLLAPVFLVSEPSYALTETLRPNAVGAESNLNSTEANNYESVDETSRDDWSTRVSATGTSYARDFYNIENSSGSGTINSVTVYAYVAAQIPYSGYGQIWIKSGGSNGLSDEFFIQGGFNLESEVWTLDPNTGSAWTWSAVDSLQIGIRLKENTGITACTQMYAIVDYSQEPAVTTNAASSVTGTTATLNGNITAINDTSISERGFVWDTTSRGDPGNTAPGSSDYANNWTESGSFSTGAYTHGLTDLSKGTTYYYRACAVNDLGNWAYGDEVDFTTLITAPDINTDAASDVAQTTARLNSTVVDDGGEACQVRWGWGETSQSSITAYDSYTSYAGSYTTGQHPYEDVSSLSPNTTYYFRVEIMNSDSAELGSELSFTTTTSVGDPSDLRGIPSAESVSLTWTKGSGSTNTIVRYRVDTYPSSYSDGTLVYDGSSSSYEHTGLSRGTTYYYAAWAYSGVTYSSGSTQAMITTSAAIAGGDTLSAPDEPTRWMADPDHTNLSNLPYIYDMVNNVADSYSIPRATVWFSIAVLFALACAFLVYKISNDAFIGLVALTIGLAFGWATQLVPLWIPVLSAIAVAFMFMVRRREMA